MPVDPARAKSLFLAVADLPAEARDVFLDNECAGDAELRARIVALLKADEPRPPDATAAFNPSMATGDYNPDAVTGTFAGPQSPRESVPATPLGTLIAGRYTLIEVIGEGGMGSVYLASQTEPVKRQVALKLIKAGMDSKSVLARFDAERQALALMDHPNIARIYDGGVTDSGQPYFVMELVKGVPLTEYCDAQRLTVDARLQLFVQVCNAVQHAHQKGIIHRDLKPGNVLVTEVDGRPTPKVIDFGVAKATEQKLTDLSFADVGAIVGTPAYMSPEQADPTSMDIDTRTDVYALGVMLYELLTGSPPIDSKQFKRGAILEMLRMVREVEAPRPSTKLSTIEALPNIAANRSIDPAKLAKLFQGELDWVVLKALEKDRTRRYDSANAFAQDIQRYLADEVVEARPPSAGYRLKKFVKRNKVQVVAASLVFFALVAGIVGTTIGLIEADKQTRTARLAEGKAADEARRAEDEAKAARLAEGKALDQLTRAEWSVYAGKLLLAQAAFNENNVPDAFHHLEDCQWNLRGWEHAHLRWRFDSSKQTLKGHTGWVSSVAFSPDGKRILTGSGDKTAKVWNAETGTELLTLKGHASAVLGVAFSPDGKRLLTGSYDNTARVWDAEKGTLLLALKKHTGVVSSVAFSPDGKRILTGSGDETAKVWDTETGTEVVKLKGRTSSVTSVAFSPDGKRILTGSWDGTKVWDAETGTELLAFNGHTQYVSSVAFSPDGKRILTGGDGKTAKVWDAETGTELLALKEHTHSLTSVAFSPDGKRLLTGSGDGTKVWDAETGTEVLALKGHSSWVTSVAFSPDGKRLLTGSRDEMAKVWNAETGTEVLALRGHTSDVNSVAFSPDGQRILTGSHDNTAKVWNAEKGTEVLALKGHKDIVLGVAFSPDGKRLLTGSRDETAKVWDAETGSELLALKGHTFPVTSVAFSPDGRKLFAWDTNDNVLAWDTITGQPVAADNPPAKPAPGLARSTDGRFIVKPDGFQVQLIDTLRPAEESSPWPLPDSAQRKKYHTEQAALAEKEKNWFAVAFHVGRLLLDDPDNGDLKNRREDALRKHGGPELAPPPRAVK